MSDDDLDLFRTEMEGVRPVTQDKVAVSRPRPRPVPRQTQRDEAEVIDLLLTDAVDLDSIETGDELVYARPGVSRSTLRRLRRGEFTVSAELDLHGHTVGAAQAALARFLPESRRLNQTCVRIIHGKGLRSPGKKPVLKAKIYRWLSRREEVLAFASARPVDGGTGAVYVLLKRTRR